MARENHKGREVPERIMVTGDRIDAIRYASERANSPEDLRAIKARPSSPLHGEKISPLGELAETKKLQKRTQKRPLFSPTLKPSGSGSCNAHPRKG